VQLVLARGPNVAATSSALAATRGARLVRGDYANVAANMCWTIPYVKDRINLALCQLPTAMCLRRIWAPEGGDSGSPVYQLVRDPGGLHTSVMAYGVLSGGYVIEIGLFKFGWTCVAALVYLFMRVDVTE